MAESDGKKSGRLTNGWSIAVGGWSTKAVGGWSITDSQESTSY